MRLNQSKREIDDSTELIERLRHLAEEAVNVEDAEADFLLEWLRRDNINTDELARIAAHHAFMTMTNMKAFETLVYLYEQEHGWEMAHALEAATDEFIRMVGRMDWVGIGRRGEGMNIEVTRHE